MTISPVGEANVIGPSAGYDRGTHIEMGNEYTLSRNETGSVPVRCKRREEAPLSEANDG